MLIFFCIVFISILICMISDLINNYEENKTMKNEKILIVDDEQIVCDSVQKILSKKGYIVDKSLNVKEAVEKIRNTSYIWS